MNGSKFTRVFCKMSARKIIDKAEKKKNANTDNQNILREYSIHSVFTRLFLGISSSFKILFFFLFFIRVYLLVVLRRGAMVMVFPCDF